MRTVAIMQPYFLPYIGYLQLIRQCDAFVFLDNVQYIDRGWVNRNRILLNGKAAWLTLPVVAAPRDLPINNRHYLLTPATRTRLLGQIKSGYRKAPHFPEMYAQLTEWMAFESPNVAIFNSRLIMALCERLGIRTPMMFASDLPCDPGLRGQHRILDICRRLEADVYLNSSGGTHLYDCETFARAGIELRFLHPTLTEYGQAMRGSGGNPLSVVDTMMYVATADLTGMLAARTVRGEEAVSSS